MTSMPASRRARAMILAPRSCPSSPGLATTTRIFRACVLIGGRRILFGGRSRARFGDLSRFRVAMGALACGLAAILLAGTPTQGKALDTVIQDDAMLLARPPAEVRQTARTIADLGADRVRLTASWSQIAPAPHALERPGRPFDPRDPGTYPPGAWDRLDTAVRAARDAGLKVMIDIGFWAPRWAVQRPSSNPSRERYRPDPSEFGPFAEAVVRPYGALADTFTPWNEPNPPSFLAPQWVDGEPQS